MLKSVTKPLIAQQLRNQIISKAAPGINNAFARNYFFTHNRAGVIRATSCTLYRQEARMFATTKKDQTDDVESKTIEKKKRGRPRKIAVAPAKEAEKQPAQASTAEKVAQEEPTLEEKAKVKRTKRVSVKKADLENLYVLKFNSPVLPYSKFPLTQNKYIQDFLKKYDEDVDNINRIVGVHFDQNSNSNAKGAVGIEITITRKSDNIAVVESSNARRYQIHKYDSKTNFAKAAPFNDKHDGAKGKPEGLIEREEIDQNYKDLLSSELFELKSSWYLYNKKINQVLMVLPQDLINRYDVVAKSMQSPVFDMSKHSPDKSIIEIFDQIVYRMAQTYFGVYQATFSKDNESVKPMVQEFLSIKDPVHRSRKILSYFQELSGLIDKKLFYVHKTAEEFKERSKTSLLEHAYQRVLQDNKKSEKTTFQEQLDAVVNMEESTRKVIQEEIDMLDAKNEMETARKVQYLKQVFRLPWDKKTDPYWNVSTSRQNLEETHFGMLETKERILEFIAKNKRVNSQRGMVLLLTGPPGVGKTSIAKSIGECLHRPTTVISMGGQNDPVHIKGSKRTYVDSQPGIFVKEVQRLETKNPVIVIDEIDKVGFNSLKGDVSSTLLELLNPEQSNQFRDSYLDIEFDFSQVIFICTSNSIANMLEPLIDRIEVINVPAYLPIEKLNIAKDYLIPQLEKEYAFSEDNSSHEKVQLTDAAIMKVINHYCGHEAGVRNLRKCLDRIYRKIVAKIETKQINDEVSEVAADASLDALNTNDKDSGEVVEYQVNTTNLERFLDIPASDDNYFRNINKQLPVGCSNGLAYVNDGYGSVLKIQFVRKGYGKAQKSKKDSEESSGQEGQFTHTGRLGEVMTESTEVVKIAVFNFLKEKNLAGDFDKDSYHLHVPMGATPKDGPSAGTSLFCALVSIATNKPVSANLAMTGEISTLGEVISIGGVREKLTACKNHDITRVVLPISNKKHVNKLPDEFKKGFTIFYVNDIKELYNVAFEDMTIDQLRESGIDVEQFEEDNFNKIVIEGEDVWKTNRIEELF